MVDIIDSVQLDTPGSGLVDMFEIEMGATTLYLYPGLENTTDSIWFANRAGTDVNQYLAVPIDMSGIDYTSEGAQSRPTLNVANIVGASSVGGDDTTLFEELSAINELSNEYFVGKKITRRRTLIANLFTEFQTPAVPEEMPVCSYIIDRISGENNIMVSFELASPLDVEGVTMPNRTVIGKYCSWEFQGYWDNKGACTWTKEGLILVANGSGGYKLFSVYYDVLDRPCISFAVAINAWSGGTYSQDEMATYDGKKWISKVDGNNDTPSLSSGKWQVMVTWETYSLGSTYEYQSPPVYGNNGVLRYNQQLWTPRRHVPTNTPPEENSIYWSRFDLCGKTITSCKVRFQAQPQLPSQSDGSKFVPSQAFNTERSLPFGGFPGTAKFR
jgi:lambda family phage minor tail protein L